MADTEKNLGYIVLVRNGHFSPRYEFNVGNHSIGKSVDCNIRIKSEKSSVLDKHAIINVNAEGVAILVNKSCNLPVRVNGKVVFKHSALYNGDTFEIVDKTFQYFNHVLKSQNEHSDLYKQALTKILTRKSVGPVINSVATPLRLTPKALPKVVPTLSRSYTTKSASKPLSLRKSVISSKITHLKPISKQTAMEAKQNDVTETELPPKRKRTLTPKLKESGIKILPKQNNADDSKKEHTDVDQDEANKSTQAEVLQESFNSKVQSVGVGHDNTNSSRLSRSLRKSIKMAHTNVYKNVANVTTPSKTLNDSCDRKDQTQDAGHDISGSSRLSKLRSKSREKGHVDKEENIANISTEAKILNLDSFDSKNQDVGHDILDSSNVTISLRKSVRNKGTEVDEDRTNVSTSFDIKQQSQSVRHDILGSSRLSKPLRNSKKMMQLHISTSQKKYQSKVSGKLLKSSSSKKISKSVNVKDKSSLYSITDTLSPSSALSDTQSDISKKTDSEDSLHLHLSDSSEENFIKDQSSKDLSGVNILSPVNAKSNSILNESTQSVATFKEKEKRFWRQSNVNEEPKTYSRSPAQRSRSRQENSVFNESTTEMFFADSTKSDVEGSSIAPSPIQKSLRNSKTNNSLTFENFLNTSVNGLENKNDSSRVVSISTQSFSPYKRIANKKSRQLNDSVEAGTPEPTKSTTFVTGDSTRKSDTIFTETLCTSTPFTKGHAKASLSMSISEVPSKTVTPLNTSASIALVLSKVLSPPKRRLSLRTNISKNGDQHCVSCRHSSVRKSRNQTSSSQTKENLRQTFSLSLQEESPLKHRKSILGSSTSENTPDKTETKDDETPKSHVKPGRRSSQLGKSSYNPPVEDITPVTPEQLQASQLSAELFKTPVNTPGLFEDIRKSALRSRKRLRESCGSALKSAKRPRIDSKQAQNDEGKNESKQQISPINRLSDFTKKRLVKKTPPRSPNNDLRHVPNLQRWVSPKYQKSPTNDFDQNVSTIANLFNVSGVEALNNGSDIENCEDLFTQVTGKVPIRSYQKRGKSLTANGDGDLPSKSYGRSRKTMGDLPLTSPRVEQWLEDQLAGNYAEETSSDVIADISLKPRRGPRRGRSVSPEKKINNLRNKRKTLPQRHDRRKTVGGVASCDANVQTWKNEYIFDLDLKKNKRNLRQRASLPGNIEDSKEDASGRKTMGAKITRQLQILDKTSETRHYQGKKRGSLPGKSRQQEDDKNRRKTMGDSCKSTTELRKWKGVHIFEQAVQNYKHNTRRGSLPMDHSHNEHTNRRKTFGDLSKSSTIHNWKTPNITCTLSSEHPESPQDEHRTEKELSVVNVAQSGDPLPKPSKRELWLSVNEKATSSTTKRKRKTDEVHTSDIGEGTPPKKLRGRKELNELHAGTTEDKKPKGRKKLAVAEDLQSESENAPSVTEQNPVLKTEELNELHAGTTENKKLKGRKKLAVAEDLQSESENAPPAPVMEQSPVLKTEDKLENYLAKGKKAPRKGRKTNKDQVEATGLKDEPEAPLLSKRSTRNLRGRKHDVPPFDANTEKINDQQETIAIDATEVQSNNTGRVPRRGRSKKIPPVDISPVKTRRTGKKKPVADLDNPSSAAELIDIAESSLAKPNEDEHKSPVKTRRTGKKKPVAGIDHPRTAVEIIGDNTNVDNEISNMRATRAKGKHIGQDTDDTEVVKKTNTRGRKLVVEKDTNLNENNSTKTKSGKGKKKVVGSKKTESVEGMESALPAQKPRRQTTRKASKTVEAVPPEASSPANTRPRRGRNLPRQQQDDTRTVTFNDHVEIFSQQNGQQAREKRKLPESQDSPSKSKRSKGVVNEPKANFDDVVFNKPVRGRRRRISPV